MSEFKFSCPNCQQNIAATSESSGLQINCPSCQTTLVVPAAPGAPAAATAPNPPAHAPRLSMAASSSSTTSAAASEAAAAAIASVRPLVKKKSKTNLIVGCCVGAIAVCAAINFGPGLVEKYKSKGSAAVAENQVDTNTPPPPPPELTTEEILQKVSDTYMALTDYAAKAKTLGDVDLSALAPGQKPMHLTADSTLQLGRTNYFRLEWNGAFGGKPLKGAAWNSGKGNFVGYGPIPPSKVKTREQAMGPAASSFIMSAGIAELFFSTTNSVAADAKDFTKTNGPPLNGQPCYVLTGQANHQDVVVWINKSSFLLSQIEVDLGAPIDEAELKKLPSAQRDALRVASKLKGTIVETYDNIQTNKNLLASAFEAAYRPTASANPGARQPRASSMAGQLTQPGSRRKRTQ